MGKGHDHESMERVSRTPPWPLLDEEEEEVVYDGEDEVEAVVVEEEEELELDGDEVRATK